MSTTYQHQRRYDLDWLRVIAFGLLIFYHVGMFYVSWGWHVKSVYAGPTAEPIMLIVNPWRLALLFFISGVAVRFATDKAPALGRYALSRVMRLGLPILVGIIFVVAPQSYFELVSKGETQASFFAFWLQYLNLEQSFSVITPTWNHLWYVAYLFVYILIVTPLTPLLRRWAEGASAQKVFAGLSHPAALLLVPIFPYVFIDLILSPIYPTTHDLVNDWANHAMRFTIFLYGYFVAKSAVFWSAVVRALKAAAMIVVFIGFGRAYLRALHWNLYVSLYDVIPVMPVLNILYAWAFIILLLGLA